MLLRSITLQDFGLYSGRQTIQLLPNTRSKQSRPVVLVGGKNGAGKTTLLEAVRLALYGKIALGIRVAQSEYEAYLRSRIHTPAVGIAPPNCSAVTLEFDFAEAGALHCYVVTRSWSARGQSVAESLEVTKDGKEITSVPREEWHTFLQDLLPPGVSQLFFFDGEKIKEIAEDSENDSHLAAAIRSLLGIELVDQLRVDLGLYITRHERTGANPTVSRLESVVRDHERLGRDIAEVNEELADLLTRLDGQKRLAEKTKHRFIAAGGDVALQRSRLQAELEMLKEQQEALIATFKEGSAGLWPLTVAPKLLASVLETFPDYLSSDIEGLAGHVQKAILSWHKGAPQATKRRWTPEHLKDLKKILADVSKSKSGARSHPVADVPHARQRIEFALKEGRADVASFANQLSELNARSHEIEAALARIDQTTTDYLFDELRAAEQSCGATQQQIDALRVSLSERSHQQSLLERERRRILEELGERSESEQKLQLATRATRALAQYETELIRHKTRALEHAFVDCFNRLARKEDLVRGVRIDERTFQATLIDAHGIDVPKKMLSAGEKQVYAIAMLWALAKTSGRSLPVIIDTPLARLDSDHRASLIGRYLPEVSHQVVLLSTDTEIDHQVMATLEPFVSHAYLLEYVPEERRTLALNGYFESVQHSGSRRALQQA